MSEERHGLSPDERWNLIDKIVKENVEFGTYKRTLRDEIGELTVKPLTGIPFAVAVLYGFWVFFGEFAGTLFTDGFFVQLFDGHWLPWLQNVFSGTPNWLYFLLVGDPGATNCFEAFGVLTSGLFVAIGVVLPAVIAFYFGITLLEDIGYIPRLATLIDTILHKVGLHGYAVVPTLLSLGCNVPGVEATRVLETKKQRFMMMNLLSVFVPCGAQIGIMTFLIPGMVGWAFLYMTIGYLLFGYLLSLLTPGRSPGILVDIPPYRRPTLRNVGKKMWMKIRRFLFVAVPFVLLGCVIVAILYITGAMSWLSDVLSPVLTIWFGVPEDTVAPLIAGFLRKDLAVGMLGGIEMTWFQRFTAVIMLTIYFPCLATFIMMIKELDWRGFLGSLGFLVVTFFAWGGLLHVIGMFLGVM